MLADYDAQRVFLRPKNGFYWVATVVAIVKRPLSGENVICPTTVAMALHEKIGVLAMNVVFKQHC